jgi:hypothetical protein
MTSDDNRDGLSSDESGAMVEDEPDHQTSEFSRADQLSVPEDNPSTLWNRRTFFKSAALGTAAAAMYEAGGAVFSPLRAYANDLSDSPCTANDVQIFGEGIVTNEPCECTGTFEAEVQFTVRNITSADRFCVAVHLNDGRDILLFGEDGTSTAFGKDQGEDFRDTIMTGFLQDFPCGGGRVCFGQEGVIRGKCEPGTCSTVAWSPNQGAANCTTPDLTPPGGQCRHQEICIVGRGNTTLDCNPATAAIDESCPVECGATATLRLCTTSDATLGPFTFTLNGQSFGPTADTCHDFVVGPITVTTLFTGCVTDADGCERCDSTTLTVTPITVTLDVAGEEACNSGNLTFTATLGSPCTAEGGAQFAFSVDGTVVQNSGLNTFNYPADPDGICHTVSVVATCGNCASEPDSITVSQCVTTTTGCTPTP